MPINIDPREQYARSAEVSVWGVALGLVLLLIGWLAFAGHALVPRQDRPSQTVRGSFVQDLQVPPASKKTTNTTTMTTAITTDD